MLTQENRNLFDRLAAIEAVVMGDGSPCFDRANSVYLLTGSGAPTSGSDEDTATGYGVAGPGSLYIDYANAKVYVQTGTINDVYWLILGNQSS
jgi:hypothetical protein